MSNTKPQRLSVAVGTVVHLYKASDSSLRRRIPGFSDMVSCTALRSDAKLIAVGEQSGILRICTTDKNTSHLRKISAHKGAVNSCSFTCDGLSVASLGADSVLRIWDVATGSETNKFVLGQAKEPARALVTGSQDANLVVAGTYDGHVKVFDIREKRPVKAFKVNDPVIKLALSKNDAAVLAASSHNIAGWDLQSGSLLDGLEESEDGQVGVRVHLKFITDMKIVDHPYESHSEVIITSGLDRLIKITSLDGFKNLTSFTLPSSVVSVAATAKCERLFAADAIGYLHYWALPTFSTDAETTGDAVKLAKPDVFDDADQRGMPGGVDRDLAEIAALFSGRGLKYKMRDPDSLLTTEKWFEKPTNWSRVGPKDWGHSGPRAPFIHENSEISRLHADTAEERRVLSKVDRLMLQFRHSDALFESMKMYWKRPTKKQRDRFREKGALVTIKKPVVSENMIAVAVIRELDRRDTLRSAVAGQSERNLDRFLRFISDNIWYKECAPACLTLAHTILDVYEPEELVTMKSFKRAVQLIQAVSSNCDQLDSFIKHMESGLPPEPVDAVAKTRKSDSLLEKPSELSTIESPQKQSKQRRTPSASLASALSPEKDILLTSGAVGKSSRSGEATPSPSKQKTSEKLYTASVSKSDDPANTQKNSNFPSEEAAEPVSLSPRKLALLHRKEESSPAKTSAVQSPRKKSSESGKAANPSSKKKKLATSYPEEVGDEKEETSINVDQQPELTPEECKNTPKKKREQSKTPSPKKKTSDQSASPFKSPAMRTRAKRQFMSGEDRSPSVSSDDSGTNKRRKSAVSPSHSPITRRSPRHKPQN